MARKKRQPPTPMLSLSKGEVWELVDVHSTSTSRSWHAVRNSRKFY